MGSGSGSGCRMRRHGVESALPRRNCRCAAVLFWPLSTATQEVTQENGHFYYAGMLRGMFRGICPGCFAELPRFGHARTVTWHLRHKRYVTWHLRHKQYFFCPIGHDGGGHGRPSPHPDDTCTTTRAGFERDLVHVRWVSVETTQAHAPLR